MLKAQFRKARKGQQGFTLLEVLIVVGIMGLLAAMVWPMKGDGLEEMGDSRNWEKAAEEGMELRTVQRRPSMLHGGKSS